jgi:hypothetical protein
MRSRENRNVHEKSAEKSAEKSVEKSAENQVKNQLKNQLKNQRTKLLRPVLKKTCVEALLHVRAKLARLHKI